MNMGILAVAKINRLRSSRMYYKTTYAINIESVSLVHMYNNSVEQV